MNKKEKLQNKLDWEIARLEDAQATVKELQAEIDSMPEEKSYIKFTPKYYEEYWFKDTAGDICSDCYSKCWYAHDYRVSTGNCYRTKEECENDTFLEDITALRDHILECGGVEQGKMHLYLCEDYWVTSGFYDAYLSDKASGMIGLFLPITATEEQKTERLRLIKKLIIK